MPNIWATIEKTSSGQAHTNTPIAHYALKTIETHGRTSYHYVKIPT